jgi:RHS repeat-associated protein
MLQATHMDLAMGLDTHIVGIPAPPAPLPVPTPIPMPFIGMIFDPMGLAVGAAIGMATGGGPGLVLVNSLPVANCGTSCTNKMTMPHIPAPGVTFIPPPAPSNDALLFFGSLDASWAGAFGVRLGDVALSCNDPVRLPVSTVLAIPKGPLVLNMKPMSPDLKAIVMAVAMHFVGKLLKKGAALFRNFQAGSKFFGRLAKALGGCESSADASRWRQMWSRAVRFVTGHPVDVVTGNLFTDVVDVSLPGPMPLVIERIYESAGSGKSGALGFGWSHSLDESLWFERARAVVRCGDGREIEFPLWNVPGRVMRRGDRVERVIHKMTLRCLGTDHFEVEHGSENRIHEFARVPGADPRVLRLVRIRSRDGQHVIHLEYDPRGRLNLVRDCGERLVRFEHDARGRLVSLFLGGADGREWQPTRRYSYDAQNNLIAVEDAVGKTWRYEYHGHLLVQETDRTGYAFYFQYDSVGPNARCVRTWGDGGRYDHTIEYDQANRKTMVEDSLGAVTVYTYNERNQVVSVLDALGHQMKYDYDPSTGGRTVEEDPAGARTERKYDAAGNLIEVLAPNGARSTLAYEGRDLVRAVDLRGGEWQWRYDANGHLVETRLPTGVTRALGWERGLVAWKREPSGSRALYEYDRQKNLTAVRLPNGSDQRYTHDALGRPVAITNALGGVTTLAYDGEGRMIETRSPTGAAQRLSYDGEGELTAIADGLREIHLTLAGRRIVRREEGSGAASAFEWDTEGRLVSITNEAGEKHVIRMDPLGRIVEETGFDGAKRRYQLDAAGRPKKVTLPSGRSTEFVHAPGGRLSEARHSDGTFTKVEYDPAGQIVAAENESGRVEFAYDPNGEVVLERFGDREVRSTYSADGDRAELRTSLGAVVAIERGAAGQPRAMRFGVAQPASLAGPPDVEFELDGLGMERARRYPNGVALLWERDSAGRTSSQRTVAPSEDGSAARERATVAYQWRGDDQIAAIIDSSVGPRFFEHDGRGRLIRERRPDLVIERAMDSRGNIIVGAEGSDRRYGPGNRLEAAGNVRFVYDADGNQTQRIEPEGRTWLYAWNGHGTLQAVQRPDGTRIEFEYDAFARRVAKRTVVDGQVRRETQFVWDGHTVVHEVDCEEGLTTWTWEPDSMTPLAKENGGRRWVIGPDHLGTPSEMFDERGALVWKARLDIFGAPSFEVGAAHDCPWRWPGQYEDADAGLLYNRMRYYTTERGSFISQDPAWLWAGLNLFKYVSDPLTWVDLLGLTGTYIFQYPSGDMYIGKGPISRARQSQELRSNQLGTSSSSISQGAHADYGSDDMGLMVEAELMDRHGFNNPPHDLLNVKQSHGRALLDDPNLSKAERRAVKRNADALEKAFLKSKGRIC